MSEINSESTSADVHASKRTMIGVGLASLMGPHGLATMPPPAQELSIQVSGEIAYEPEPHATTRRSTARIVRSSPVFPPMPQTRRGWKLAALAIGSLGLSIVIGLGARHLLASDEVESPVPIEVSAPIAAPAAIAAPAPIQAPVAIAAPAPVAAPAAIAVPSPKPITAATQRAVDLGGGSCSAVVDASSIGDVSVDGQTVGSTPVAISGLWCGRQMTVRINRTGFQSWSRTIITQEGRVSRIAATLRRPAPTPAPVAPTTPLTNDAAKRTPLENLVHTLRR